MCSGVFDFVCSGFCLCVQGCLAFLFSGVFDYVCSCVLKGV